MASSLRPNSSTYSYSSYSSYKPSLTNVTSPTQVNVPPPTPPPPPPAPIPAPNYTQLAQDLIGATQDQTDYTKTPEYQQMQEAIAKQNELMNQLNTQLADVQSQYDQLAKDYEARDSELTQYLEGMGDTERKNLEKQRAQLKASQKEDLMRRGLTSSSALSAALRGVDMAANESLSAMEERLRQQKLDYKAQFSGESLAAKRMAAEYGSQASMLMFQSGTMVPQTMAQLADMLSQQRQSREQARASIIGSTLGAEAQRYSASTSAAASNYATKAGYMAEMAGLTQRERESQRSDIFNRLKLGEETKLGYQSLQTQRDTSRQANPQHIVSQRYSMFGGGARGPWG